MEVKKSGIFRTDAEKRELIRKWTELVQGGMPSKAACDQLKVHHTTIYHWRAELEPSRAKNMRVKTASTEIAIPSKGGRPKGSKNVPRPKPAYTAIPLSDDRISLSLTSEQASKLIQHLLGGSK